MATTIMARYSKVPIFFAFFSSLFFSTRAENSGTNIALRGASPIPTKTALTMRRG